MAKFAPDIIMDGALDVIASASGTVISARVAGGTAGVTGAVTFAWTTAGGDNDERTVYLRVAER